MNTPGLGRRAAPDHRDRGYLLRAALPETVVRKTKYWAFFFQPPDQNGYGCCVGEGWKNWMLAAPTVQTKPDREPTAFTIYREAILIDEWADNDQDGDAMQIGTSVRAGAQVLQARGLLQSYGWCWDADTAANWLCTQGPLVIGIAFYDSFFDPDSTGFLKITPGARVVGGHCMLLLGWNERTGAARGINSWGAAWNGKQRGRFWIDGETLDRLLRNEGEACSAIEIRDA